MPPWQKGVSLSGVELQLAQQWPEGPFLLPRQLCTPGLLLARESIEGRSLHGTGDAAGAGHQFGMHWHVYLFVRHDAVYNPTVFRRMLAMAGSSSP